MARHGNHCPLPWSQHPTWKLQTNILKSTSTFQVDQPCRHSKTIFQVDLPCRHSRSTFHVDLPRRTSTRRLSTSTFHVDLPRRPSKSTFHHDLPCRPCTSTFDVDLPGRPSRSTFHVDLRCRPSTSTFPTKNRKPNHPKKNLESKNQLPVGTDYYHSSLNLLVHSTPYSRRSSSKTFPSPSVAMSSA